MALQSWYRKKYPLGMKEWTPERLRDYLRYSSEYNSRPRLKTRGPRPWTRKENRQRTPQLRKRATTQRDLLSNSCPVYVFGRPEPVTDRQRELRRSCEAYLKQRQKELAGLKPSIAKVIKPE